MRCLVLCVVICFTSYYNTLKQKQQDLMPPFDSWDAAILKKPGNFSKLIVETSGMLVKHAAFFKPTKPEEVIRWVKNGGV